MKAGWVGNTRLQALVRSKAAILVAEIVELQDAHVKDVKSDWQAGTVVSGSRQVLDSGGATIQASSVSLVAEVANDGATLNLLRHTLLAGESSIFNAVVVTWSGSRAEDIEIHNMVARLDPRRDGGQPKNVVQWRAQLFRVVRILTGGIEEGGFTMSPISREVIVAVGAEEAPTDYTFNFESLAGGSFPRVGLPPTGAVLTDANPRTVVRIIGLQADGTPATNVAWMANSGQSAASAGGYVAESVAVTPLSSRQAEEVGGSAYRLTTGADYPEFTLGQAEYATLTVRFDGADEVPDLTGSGDLVIVARGETPSDSEITYEISDDGATWAECFDGDVIGVDNTPDGGGDLSGISTTGPWDLRYTLTPSAAADLNAPTVREFGVERVERTLLRGAAEFVDGGHGVDPVTLRGEIASAELRIKKTGENDFRDYGSTILSRSHIGQITVRIWVADVDGSQLTRKEWMLHSAWDVDDYRSTDTEHVVALISPLRRIHNVTIPPFIVASGNDGTRTAVRVEGTLKEAYEEILDSMIAVAGRFRGPGVEDDTNTVGKRIVESDAKDELDRIAYADGSAIIASQGRIKAVKVLRDGSGGDTPIAFFPHGSYDAGAFGPGFSTRTDEFFVRYNWNEVDEFFENERRYLNAVAFDKLGGVGINTTQKLDVETCKWINSEALADLIGNRVPHHFATGQIVWPIHTHDWHPELEEGDPVAIETTRFVGRSPFSDTEIRGRVSAIAIVIDVRGKWGQDLLLWVPSFDKIVPADGGVTRDFALEDEQTILIHATTARPNDDTVPIDVSNGYLQNRTAGSQVYRIPVLLPPGVTVTAVAANLYRQDTNGTASAAFREIFESGDIVSSLIRSTLTHATTGWDVVSETLGVPFTVATNKVYEFIITLDNLAGAAADEALLWCRVTYTRNSLSQRI